MRETFQLDFIQAVFLGRADITDDFVIEERPPVAQVAAIPNDRLNIVVEFIAWHSSPA